MRHLIRLKCNPLSGKQLIWLIILLYLLTLHSSKILDLNAQTAWRRCARHCVCLVVAGQCFKLDPSLGSLPDLVFVKGCGGGAELTSEPRAAEAAHVSYSWSNAVITDATRLHSQSRVMCSVTSSYVDAEKRRRLREMILNYMMNSVGRIWAALNPNFCCKTPWINTTSSLIAHIPNWFCCVPAASLQSALHGKENWFSQLFGIFGVNLALICSNLVLLQAAAAALQRMIIKFEPRVSAVEQAPGIPDGANNHDPRTLKMGGKWWMMHIFLL